MSDDVRGNLLGADESDWQEEETGLENDEYFDEDDFDPAPDDLAVIGSMGLGEAERIECSKGDGTPTAVAKLRSRWLVDLREHAPRLKGRVC